ncbi:PREDICTED: G2/M phase-specific E3 ubiquitin-protein ligase-like [Priapulus caudatus]|uniref:G2/M phase-specific E3 ubiquitin-protein ligase-like n=1 Tax=Priapulus caudatus TaxID=37621 RepID=A0ABM1EHK0_PRICU|nr:PREDICTED: G2/M phase-specific E3 ubiquitin-protein ligase-like [Priapulus caudatus]
MVQEVAVTYWRDFVEDCEDPVNTVQLRDVLIFSTALEREPPMGFHPTPTIEFVDGLLPKASTCMNVLYLPTSHDSYDKFSEWMKEGIIGAHGFGLA